MYFDIIEKNILKIHEDRLVSNIYNFGWARGLNHIANRRLFRFVRSSKTSFLCLVRDFQGKWSIDVAVVVIDK